MSSPNTTADVFAKSGSTGNGSGSGSGAAGGNASGAAGSRGRETIECDICVIGAGSGGLSVAAAAAAFGVKVVLLEKHKMGGDCLNYGCVPSKALLAAGKRAQSMRSSTAFGVKPHEPEIDHAAVNDHVKQVIASIAPNDSVERFTGLGVHVITAAGRFVSKDTVEAGEQRIKARRFVIATGSAPLVPPIPGLNSVPYFTNETIFDNRGRIDHLLIVGGGPIGLEMAQAHRRLGSKVTVLEGVKALGKDDPELTKVVIERLRSEGVDIREHTSVVGVEQGETGGVRVRARKEDREETFEGSHILIAVGRKPNVEDLGLDAAGVSFDKRGIKVDRGLVTSNKHVYAIGDVTGGLQFTHVANYHAGIVVRKALFRLPAKVDDSQIPWVTFTDPELAHVGLSEDQAIEKHGKVSVLRWPYHENDRAQAERATSGHVKVIVAKNGRILGASIVGEHAGELIQMWSLAIANKMKISAMRDWISPYPTLSEINKRAAYKFYTGVASSPVVRKVISLLAKLG